ncbi:hypothetical protein OG753_02020 [Streptomyces sp. NBC_00029]|uniref:hypothetical protein n=1 Tax=Streptomyces sp. NBC_00029 TaxID=2903613 RepID=UPI0032488D76
MHMQRADILSNIAASGTGTDPQRLSELAAELDIPAADLLVVAGHPVPAELLPPDRDPRVMREFAFRASHCNHLQLASLEAFVRSLPRHAATAPFVQPVSGPYRPAGTGFGSVLNGLIRNRGFGVRELPFMGLSRSTLNMIVTAPWEPDRHRRHQLVCLAGPLAWTLPDLFALAGEPYSEEFRPGTLCRHVGRVFTAAVHLTTSQLIEATEEADRLTAREDYGVFQLVSQGFVAECPDHL